MRYLRVILSWVFIIFSISVVAQTNGGRISGAVITGDQKALESATITLLKNHDSSVVKLSVADRSGKFEFDNIPEGKYLVLVSAVGYDSAYSGVEISSTASDVNLKTIRLVPRTESLAGVVVTAKR